MKIIIANANFKINSVKYDFMELELERKTNGFISKAGEVNTSDPNYETLYYQIPVGTTALRISGYADNTALVGIFDSNDNVVDIVSEAWYTTGGTHVTYTLQNEIRQFVSSGSYIGVTHYKASDVPIKIEYTTDTLENEELNIGYYFDNAYYLTIQGVKTANSDYEIKKFNVEGISKIKLSGTFRNCCALAFYSDLALSNLVAIGQNNGGTIATYELEDVVTNVPSGAKYAAISYYKSQKSTVSVKNFIA